MAVPSPMAATPSMRDVRDQYLSVLLSAGGRPDVPPQRPMPHHTPVTPAPSAFARQNWTPGSRMSAVTWASPIQPVEADLRVAELTAGLVTASDVEKRQAATIRRLAEKLQQAERYERSLRHGSRRDAKTVHSTEPHYTGKKTRLRQEITSTARESQELISESHRKENVNHLSNTREPRALHESARKRQGSSGQLVDTSVSQPIRNHSDTKQSSSKKNMAMKKGEIEDLRRRVFELESVAKLAKENAALRTERAAAEAEALNLANLLTEIRQTVSSLVTDREHLVVTIRRLEQEHHRITSNSRGAECALEASLPSAMEDRKEQKIPPTENYSEKSPLSVRFSNFNSDGIATQGPQSDESLRDSCVKDLGDVSYARLSLQENSSAAPDQNIENKLRAELRDVLHENAMLSSQLMDFKTQHHCDAEDRLRDFHLSAKDKLQDLRSEVEVLSCVVRCLHFQSDEEDIEHIQDTVTALGEASDASVYVTSEFISNRPSCDFETQIHSEVDQEIGEVVAEIANIRRAIALKFGRWLSTNQLPASRSDGETSAFASDTSSS